MAEEVQKSGDQAKDVQPTPKLTVEICRQFQQLTDPKERKAFYEAHPELGQLYSAVNFHVA
jgi:hypothetical protein